MNNTAFLTATERLSAKREVLRVIPLPRGFWDYAESAYAVSPIETLEFLQNVIDSPALASVAMVMFARISGLDTSNL